MGAAVIDVDGNLGDIVPVGVDGVPNANCRWRTPRPPTLLIIIDARATCWAWAATEATAALLDRLPYSGPGGRGSQ